MSSCTDHNFIDTSKVSSHNTDYNCTGIDNLRDTRARTITAYPFNQIVATLARVPRAGKSHPLDNR